MSYENQNLEKFTQIIINETAIQEQLKMCTDIDNFSQTMCKLGKDYQCNFSTEDVKNRLLKAHHELDKMYEIPDETYILDNLVIDAASKDEYFCCNGTWCFPEKASKV